MNASSASTPPDADRLWAVSQPPSDALLLPYQSKWVGDESQVAICEKSRQVGISWAQALKTALIAARRTRPGSTYYVSYNRDMTRQFVADVATAAQAYDLAAGEVHEQVLSDPDGDVTVWRVVFATGKEVVGMTSLPRVLRSRRGHVIIDEAAFVDDLNALVDAGLAMLIWGWTLRIISTHFGSENPFAEIIQEVESGELDYSLHKITFEQAVRQGLYRRVLAVQDRADEWSPEAERDWVRDVRRKYGSRAAQELDCIPAAGSGRYFPALLITRAMGDIPVLEWRQTNEFTYRPEDERKAETMEWVTETLQPALGDVPERAACYVGMDIGRSGDLSVIAVVRRQRERVSTIAQVELRNVPFSEQERILHWLLRHVRFRAACIDTRGIGHMLGEQAAQEFGPRYVEQVMMSRKTHAESWPPYKQLLEDAQYDLPRSDGVRDDHRVVQLVDGTPTVAASTGPEGERRHGDAAVAHMLAVRAIAFEGGADQDYAHQSVPVASTPLWLGHAPRDDDDDPDEDPEWDRADPSSREEMTMTGEWHGR